MLKELKELKKISESQEEMANMLSKVYQKLPEDEEPLTEELYYESLKEEENQFFLDTVFEILDNELDNGLKNVINLESYKDKDNKHIFVFLNLSDEDEKEENSVSNVFSEELYDWDVFVKLKINCEKIELKIRNEDLILSDNGYKRVNSYINKLKEAYFNIKKENIIKVFDNIINYSKLSRSEFLNQFEFLDDE